MRAYYSSFLFAFALGCGGKSDCGEGTHEEDGTCVADEAVVDEVDGGADDGGTDEGAVDGEETGGEETGGEETGGATSGGEETGGEETGGEETGGEETGGATSGGEETGGEETGGEETGGATSGGEETGGEETGGEETGGDDGGSIDPAAFCEAELTLTFPSGESTTLDFCTSFELDADYEFDPDDPPEVRNPFIRLENSASEAFDCSVEIQEPGACGPGYYSVDAGTLDVAYVTLDCAGTPDDFEGSFTATEGYVFIDELSAGDEVGDLTGAPLLTIVSGSIDVTSPEMIQLSGNFHIESLVTGIDAEESTCSVDDGDRDGDGFISTEFGGGDCDDTDASINPDAVEVCDYRDTDEDCSGLADDLDPGVDPDSLYPSGSCEDPCHPYFPVVTDVDDGEEISVVPTRSYNHMYAYVFTVEGTPFPVSFDGVEAVQQTAWDEESLYVEFNRGSGAGIQGFSCAEDMVVTSGWGTFSLSEPRVELLAPDALTEGEVWPIGYTATGVYDFAPGAIPPVSVEWVVTGDREVVSFGEVETALGCFEDVLHVQTTYALTGSVEGMSREGIIDEYYAPGLGLILSTDTASDGTVYESREMIDYVGYWPLSECDESTEEPPEMMEP